MFIARGMKNSLFWNLVPSTDNLKDKQNKSFRRSSPFTLEVVSLHSLNKKHGPIINVHTEWASRNIGL